MSFDVDAIMRQVLSMVTRKRPIKPAHEKQWEWLTDCWEDVADLSRKLGSSVGEVGELDELLAKASTGDDINYFRRLMEQISGLSLISVELNAARDSEGGRQMAADEMREMIGGMRESFLLAGSAIGWHPRHIREVRILAQDDSGYRQALVPLALRLAAVMSTEPVRRCFLDSVLSVALLDEMEVCMRHWRDVLPDIRIPEKVVARGWRHLRGAGSHEIAISVNDMRRDVRCLLETAHRCQVERDISLVEALFAARRLEQDIKELRGMMLLDSEIFERH